MRKQWNKNNKKDEYEKCPKCGKKTLVTNKKLKRNFPFGRKSKPRYMVKKEIHSCISISKPFCRYYNEVKKG